MKNQPARLKQRALVGILMCMLAIAVLALSCQSSSSRGGSAASASQSEAVVSKALGVNKLGVDSSDLREMANPKGDGAFVYVPQTRFYGVERYVLWMVIDGRAYPVNGATKNITPTLQWPREAPDDLWKRTGFSPFLATEAIEIVFGG